MGLFPGRFWNSGAACPCGESASEDSVREVIMAGGVRGEPVSRCSVRVVAALGGTAAGQIGCPLYSAGRPDGEKLSDTLSETAIDVEKYRDDGCRR